jgi:hypothetical protein
MLYTEWEFVSPFSQINMTTMLALMMTGSQKNHDNDISNGMIVT